MTKIFSYNHFLIQNFIQNKNFKIFEQYKSKHFEEWYPIYRNLPLEGWSDYPVKDNRKTTFGSSVWFYDRTQTIPHYLNIYHDSPIPNLTSSSKSFADLCFERAKQLIDTGEKINLFWSGGLDSTNVFFCLDKFKPKSQLKIYLTYNSIIESGMFFDKYIKGVYEYDLSIPKPPKEQIWDDGIILNGSAADQAFGVPEGITQENIDKPFQNYINEKDYDFVKPVLDIFPVPIKTYMEFKWFLSFVFKYTAGKRIVYSGRNIRPSQKVTAFYDTKEFQIWSMLNKEPKLLNNDLTTFKWPLRNLIYENSGEKNYAYKKGKNHSNYSIHDSEWLVSTIDENGFIKRYDWKNWILL